MLINGNSEKTPLADGSVHCVVTSPPYWGLRDYGLPPSIWGGAADCAHVWGDEQTFNKDRQHLAELGERLGCLGGKKHSASADKYNSSTGQFCRRCDAWRGTLGLEPSIELFVAHLVQVMREVRRVLREDGTCWLNLGSSFISRKAESDEMVLREDLTPDEKEFVLTELAKHVGS